jgi:hypothetical protein
MNLIRALVFLCSISCIHAAEPAWASRITSPKPGTHPAIIPQKLHYSLSWNGQIAAGAVQFSFGSEGTTAQTLECFCEGGSKGMAANLFPYRFDMTGKVHRSQLSPMLVHCNETDDKETLVTTVRFQANQVRVTEISRPHRTGVDTTAHRNFSYTPVFDAFSIMLFIRSHQLANGDSLSQVLHPFKSPYLATIHVLGREKVHGKDAIKLSIGLEKIKPDLSLKPYAKMKTATLWISDDKHRIPLELRVAAFIGDVRMSLTKQEML